MTSDALDLDAGLRVMTGGLRAGDGWTGALAEFFEIGRRLLNRVHADVHSSRLASPSFLHGAAGQPGLARMVESLLSRINLEYEIELNAPFEETESIAGALWSGRELFDANRDDGLAKLRFARGTLDLPVHVHEHSDRFIAVLEGAGRFWWSEEPWRDFRGTDIQSVTVSAGDVLVFTRNLLHTFSAPSDDLLLLSYHSPEIPFDDPRQYTLPALRWTPRQVGLQ